MIYQHPGQPQMQVEVILASSHLGCPPIYTLRLRYPRILHSEVMTHRTFSRNARSSRAVPVQKMLDEVRNTPFVPWHWGANQKGMQATEECNELIKFRNDTVSREAAWLRARDNAVSAAEGFMNAGYHKQIPNRLLEPFMWIDTLITATDWANFLWLRDHEAAEPHLQDLARLVRQALDECVPQTLEENQWHTPYVDDQDLRVSAARCARISYTPFDGNGDRDSEIARYDSLIGSDRVHASPVEHQALPDPTNYAPHLHGNLTGWIQFRKTIPNEVHNG